MIPESWMSERASLRLQQHAQSKRDYVFAPDEVPITAEFFEALDARPVTTADLTQLTDGSLRGLYAVGDTQGFVLTEEDKCQHYNCWMVRAANGAPLYHSEPQS